MSTSGIKGQFSISIKCQSIKDYHIINKPVHYMLGHNA